MERTELYGHPLEVSLMHETIYLKFVENNIHLRTREHLGRVTYESVHTGKVLHLVDLIKGLTDKQSYEFQGGLDRDPGCVEFFRTLGRANQARVKNMRGDYAEEDRKFRLSIYSEAKRNFEEIEGRVKQPENAGNYDLSCQYRIAEMNVNEAVGGIHWQDFLDLKEAGEFGNPRQTNYFRHDEFMAAVNKEMRT